MIVYKESDKEIGIYSGCSNTIAGEIVEAVRASALYKKIDTGTIWVKAVSNQFKRTVFVTVWIRCHGQTFASWREVDTDHCNHSNFSYVTEHLCNQVLSMFSAAIDWGFTEDRKMDINSYNFHPEYEACYKLC